MQVQKFRQEVHAREMPINFWGSLIMYVEIEIVAVSYWADDSLQKKSH